MHKRKPVALLVCVVMLTAAGLTAHAASVHHFTKKDSQEVKDVFLRQAEAATSHDIVAFEHVLASTPADQPDPVALVARAYQFWGKNALVDHFRETFKAVWKFEPDVETIKVVPLTPDTAEIFAVTRVTSGASEASSKTASFLVYEVAIRTLEGWRIAAIVPVPAQ
jgi:ketosteroid isomerase-like protein